MLFKCKNCGGNAVYDPDKEAMCCPHCDSIDSQEKLEGVDYQSCINCGAPITPLEFTSATKCPNCGSYIIFDERVQGEYTPHLILPFKISKNKATEMIRGEFKKRVFTPSSFLSAASLKKMEGTYVPFFMYDYDVDAVFRGKGTKVRKWTTGNTEYTETSYYSVERDMDVSFDKIPVDASVNMDDKIMDLMEPYDYKALESFQEHLMSGFLGERFSQTIDELEPRAKEKSARDTRQMLRESVSGYTTLSTEREEIRMTPKGRNYALLPVWIYHYNYQGKTYTYHVNGQTGKVIGVTPVSKPKVMGYSATVFGLCMVAGFLAYAMSFLL